MVQIGLGKLWEMFTISVLRRKQTDVVVKTDFNRSFDRESHPVCE